MSVFASSLSARRTKPPGRCGRRPMVVRMTRSHEIFTRGSTTGGRFAALVTTAADRGAQALAARPRTARLPLRSKVRRFTRHPPGNVGESYARCAGRVPGHGLPVMRGEGDVERETGIEPATNSLGSCDSTTELLPPGGDAPILAEACPDGRDDPAPACAIQMAAAANCETMPEGD